MNFIPAKRKKVRTKEVEKREFPQHRRFVRKRVCAVYGASSEPCSFRSECAHVRAGLPEGEQAGVSQKPHDAFTVPLCSYHHREQHRIGEPAFERKYGVRLLNTALALARISPCEAVKSKAKLLGENT